MALNGIILLSLIAIIVTCSRKAFDTLSWGRQRKLLSEKSKYANKVEEWLKHEDSYKSIFTILLYFILLFVGTLLFSYSHKYSFFGVYKFFPHNKELVEILIHFLPAVILSIAIIALSELLFKLLFHRFDLEILSFVMPIFKLISKTLLLPAVLFLKVIAKFKNTKKAFDDEDKPSTEDEIMSLIEKDEGDKNEDSSLEDDEKQMIKGIFELDDTIVREIMTPRVDVIALPEASEISNAVDLFIKSGHSRLPVYQSTIDEITGIIIAKDFLKKGELLDKNLKDFVHKPYYIPETKSTLSLLNELKCSRNHFSVVIDEYGGTAGIITMEDILEEIVGEIHDEHEFNPDIELTVDDQGFAVIEARTLLDEVEELFDINLPEDEDVDTIGGLVSAILGRIPDPGEELTIDNTLHVKVLNADRRRVLTLKINRID